MDPVAEKASPEIEDALLVARTLAGERQAFEPLYDRYAARVRAFCWSHTGNVSDALDLTQEVFLRAYQKLPALKKPERFGVWLFSIAKRAGAEWRRSKKRYERVHRDRNGGETGKENGPSPEAAEAVRRALDRLSPRERLVVASRYLEEREAEAARGLAGLSRSGYYKVLDRALRKLRAILGDLEEEA